ncbi:hypothetical protein LEP1GSC103_0940 [Leptospira borgpetersenii serovar Javanica str. UI 09931]|uniref:Uncharacterized protein n=1 Tax=Leptospira borgpetersenii serovar Javanica str. UI 09931 TaxID=1049767 RepID=A0AAV3JIR3_LEPBO|nr:hypothetical protein [Leptospira borgpetersenii]EKQ91259.1 hypothetical protein LEP1GSC101_1381 [Leptospira borgpetersenii str. UI 09149]EKR02250.1 hypothetical protein LEP1GSC121_0771 [Leptospira borgpetersenii serovar Castellonis str. 200801910]EMN58963.1 hypothetical protein LEP1GSC090_2942 [Leptospira borgpetersenii serovar Javanica str. MK146]EMO11053.1 hypothetical protein LEP1GSC137_2189 [Leptospira borgpetersenii str. Noumea 25]EPG59779.1 hypothetical protein LEP1GSC103_0940 [Leptos
MNGSKLNHFLDSKGFIDEELRLPDFATDLGREEAIDLLKKLLSSDLLIGI